MSGVLCGNRLHLQSIVSGAFQQNRESANGVPGFTFSLPLFAMNRTLFFPMPASLQLEGQRFPQAEG
jgi:hypothetical protein